MRSPYVLFVILVLLLSSFSRFSTVQAGVCSPSNPRACCGTSDENLLSAEQKVVFCQPNTIAPPTLGGVTNTTDNACLGSGVLAGTCTTRADYEIGYYLNLLQTGKLDCGHLPSQYFDQLYTLHKCPIAIKGTCVYNTALNITAYQWSPAFKGALRVGTVVNVSISATDTTYTTGGNTSLLPAELRDAKNVKVFTFPACTIVTP